MAKVTKAYKIELEVFIKTLVGLYEEGFDYIDLEFVAPSKPGEEPLVRIKTKEEYLSEEDEENEENEEEQRELPPASPLNEEDLENMS